MSQEGTEENKNSFEAGEDVGVKGFIENTLNLIPENDKKRLPQINEEIEKFVKEGEKGVRDVINLAMVSRSGQDTKMSLLTLALFSRKVVEEREQSRLLDEEQKDIQAGEIFESLTRRLNEQFYS